MKTNTALMVLVLLSGCLLTACSVDDADIFDAQNNYLNADSSYGGVYDGEWTVDKAVKDTARLEVTDVLKLRLPEKYLGISCFEKESFSSLFHTFEYKGQPAIMRFTDQGYSDYASFNSLSSTEKNYNGTTHFSHASFFVAVDSVDYRVDLLSDEPGNAVHRNDNGQWTIGFTVTAYNVTNLETHEEQMRTPHHPIALYYSTKNRIR